MLALLLRKTACYTITVALSSSQPTLESLISVSCLAIWQQSIKQKLLPCEPASRNFRCQIHSRFFHFVYSRRATQLIDIPRPSDHLVETFLPSSVHRQPYSIITSLGTP